MQPILYHLSGNDATSTAVVYVLALLIFLYALWTGWKASLRLKGAASAKAADKTAATASAKTADKAAATASAKAAAKAADKGTGKNTAGSAATATPGATAALEVYGPLLRNGGIGLGIALLGLWYILPELPGWGKAHGAGLPIPGYGVLVASGFMAAAFFSSQMAAWEWLGEEGLKRKAQIFDLMFYIFLGAIVGARVLFILVNLEQYTHNPLSVFSLQGGLVFYGGLIGASIAAFFFARKYQIPFLRLADIAMPAVSLGQCLGRLGCFAASCCHGRIAGEGTALAVRFPGSRVKDLAGNPSPELSVAFASHTRDGRCVDLATGSISEATSKVDALTGKAVAICEGGLVKISEWALQNDSSLPVHPTQLYEAAGQFVLFVLLLSLRAYRRFHGQIFGMWLLCYATLRLGVELFRGDLERGTLHHFLKWVKLPEVAANIPLEAWYNMSTGQFISLGMAALGAWVLARGWRRRVTPSPLPGLDSCGLPKP